MPQTRVEPKTNHFLFFKKKEKGLLRINFEEHMTHIRESIQKYLPDKGPWGNRMDALLSSFNSSNF